MLAEICSAKSLVVVTHAETNDGDACAAVIRTAVASPGFDFWHIRMQPNEKLNKILPDYVDTVVICGVLPHPIALAELRTACTGNIHIVDHHESNKPALDALAKQPKTTVTYAKGFAACEILFDMLCPDKRCPALISRIGARHVFRKDADQDSSSILSTYLLLRNMPSILATEKRDIYEADAMVQSLSACGVDSMLLGIYNKQLAALRDAAVAGTWTVPGFPPAACVLVVFGPGQYDYITDTLIGAAKANGLLLGVGVMYEKDGRVKLFYRSADTAALSVIPLAQAFGGGGHRGASGCMLAAPSRSHTEYFAPR